MNIAAGRRLFLPFHRQAVARAFTKQQRLSQQHRSLSTTIKRSSSTLLESYEDEHSDVQILDHGRQFEVNFGQGQRYAFHTAWLYDSLPSRAGPETHRVSVHGLHDLETHASLTSAAMIADGPENESIELTFSNGNVEHVPMSWLKAYAPFVGKPLSLESPTSVLPAETSSLLDDAPLQLWTTATFPNIPTFSAPRLQEDPEYQILFLEECLTGHGVAMVTDMGPPPSMARDQVGQPLEQLVKTVVAQINAHPIRQHRTGVIQKKATPVVNQGKDYNASDPLSMHTDHSPYHGVPGYLQFMYQAQGSVTSKVCDGMAVAAHVREHHPEAYHLLSTLPFTHALRNVIYTAQGKSRSVDDPTQTPYDFELINTHPILVHNAQGRLTQVIQSESKRGVCAWSYDDFQPALDAYRLWMSLCEDDHFVKNVDWPEHTMLVMNNHRILHGRASVPPGMERTMVFGYTNKQATENRYRLLKMKQQQDNKWLLRTPNPVLRQLLK